MMPGSLGRRRRARGPKSRGWRNRWLALLSLLVLAALTVGAGFWFWARRGGPLGEVLNVQLSPEATVDDISLQLEDLGALDDVRLFKLYLELTHTAPKIQRGTHVLRRGLTPAALVARLTRSSARPTVKLTIPEGYNQFQVAHRLQALEISGEQAFLRASADAQLLAALEIGARSAEGYLFPATYDLYVDSDPAGVLETLVRETARRFRQVANRYPKELAERRASAGWGMHELLTLASIVEKEAANPEEHGRIASVFHNRLNDPSFRPRQMLQSDPTAGYGCLLARDEIASCHDYAGRVTPAMLRDAANEYNTYKHPGLPPGPIANPSQSALEAVVNPPKTPYFFFVLGGRSKRHVFSRTLAEHERAIASGYHHDRAPTAGSASGGGNTLDGASAEGASAESGQATAPERTDVVDEANATLQDD
jgi:peptidoglycan lytic transglycosylase G